MPLSTIRCSLGLDFGTESGRAVVVNLSTGEILGTAVHRYADGVIDERLPGTNTQLGSNWALQNPDDYLQVLRYAIPEALQQAGIRPSQVVGLGIDFTACTILPTLADGTPLCFLPEWSRNPHAWVKLWKHHAAQPEADYITAIAAERAEPWLARYGGKISSEWLHSKTLQLLREAPEVYSAAERIVEAGDWLVWQLTGKEVRNACAAGYKGLWERGNGYPSEGFLTAIDPRLSDLNRTRLIAPVVAPGAFVGTLSEAGSSLSGLLPGTAVAAATIDAHAAVPGVGVTQPGTMVMILGTSSCHMLLSKTESLVPGISGVVADGILPGLFGYESGQAGVGDLFEWLVEQATPPRYFHQAERQGRNIYQVLEQEAAKQKPGEHGLLALDWWNGNRSVLTDASLSGLLVGLTLATRASDIYRALIEATAFGARVIIEVHEADGVAVQELVACGGLAERNHLLMQIYADVTGRPIRQGGSGMASALGAAMFGAVAAGTANGGYATICDAAERMVNFKSTIFYPITDHQPIYNQLYNHYLRLHDHFGRGGNDVMKRLRQEII